MSDSVELRVRDLGDFDDVEVIEVLVAVGDEVATTSGMLGKVRKIEDAFVVLKVAENVELKFQKVAVHAVLPKGTIKGIG